MMQKSIHFTNKEEIMRVIISTPWFRNVHETRAKTRLDLYKEARLWLNILWSHQTPTDAWSNKGVKDSAVMVLFTKKAVDVALRGDSEESTICMEWMTWLWVCRDVSLLPDSLIYMKVTKTSQGHPAHLFSARGPKALHSLVAGWPQS